MKELEELESFCQERKMWLTYCSYRGQYKCYVNPGTTMNVAPWYKERDEAIRAAKEAAGYYKTVDEDKDPFCPVLLTESELTQLKTEDLPPLSQFYIDSAVAEKAEEYAGPQLEVIRMVDGPEILTSNGEYVGQVVKRRGRPKGSKNKPKDVTNE